jgi:hypothetical protein
MRRVACSRRHLAGLLRRSPILDSVATVPNGPGLEPVDEFGVMLEMVDAGPPSEEVGRRGDDDGPDYPRGSRRI